MTTNTPTPHSGSPADHRPDPVTETIVLAFIDLINERKLAGRTELAATHDTIARWLSERTDLPLQPRHIGILTHTMKDAGLITIGGGGIGYPNTYDTTETHMGPDAFWDQVDALLLVWQHPSRHTLAG